MLDFRRKYQFPKLIQEEVKSINKPIIIGKHNRSSKFYYSEEIKGTFFMKEIYQSGNVLLKISGAHKRWQLS